MWIYVNVLQRHKDIDGACDERSCKSVPWYHVSLVGKHRNTSAWIVVMQCVQTAAVNTTYILPRVSARKFATRCSKCGFLLPLLNMKTCNSRLFTTSATTDTKQYICGRAHLRAQSCCARILFLCHCAGLGVVTHIHIR